MVLKPAQSHGDLPSSTGTFNWTSVVLKLHITDSELPDEVPFNWTSVVLKPFVALSALGPTRVTFNWTSVVLKRKSRGGLADSPCSLLIGPVWY